MAKVVVEISGGVVQQVYSDLNDIEVVKVDWDAGESPGDEVEVGAWSVATLEQMWPETRAAVESLKSRKSSS